MILDDTTYQRIQGMLKNIDTFLSSLNNGEGQAGRLLTNPQLYESLNGTLSSMRDFLKDFRQNPQKYLRVRLRKRK
jgi:phospholipid/cholesterol/gamma-HCH transport system substrate-binding protein